MWIYILLAKCYSTSSDSSHIVQSLYDGRDVCSSVPQSDDFSLGSIWTVLWA